MAVPSVSISAKHVEAPEAQGFLTGAAGEPPMRTVYLGRVPASDKLKGRCLRFERFLDESKLTPPPAERTWDNAASRVSIAKVYGNDSQGDCVIASDFHGDGIASAHESGTANTGTTNEAMSEYHRICGHLGNDAGCIIQEVLDVGTTGGGISVGGKKRKNKGYAQIDPSNQLAVKTAILVSGGGVRIGFNVPASWMGANTYEGAVWDVPQHLNFVGGHDIRAVGYNEIGVQFATWGIVVTMTWAALADSRIVDEMWIQFYEDWNTDGTAPSGLDTAALEAAMAAFKGGTVPDWEPPVTGLRLTATPSAGVAPLNVNFSANLILPATAVLNYGDGSPTVTYSGGTTSHVYQSPGSYSATLTSDTASSAVSISVSTVPPPVPPSPPVPPPPVSYPVYDLELDRSGPFGKFIGTATPRGDAAPPANAINPVVIADAIALVLAILSKDPVKIAAAIAKLIADLGLTRAESEQLLAALKASK